MDVGDRAERAQLDHADPLRPPDLFGLGDDPRGWHDAARDQPGCRLHCEERGDAAREGSCGVDRAGIGQKPRTPAWDASPPIVGSHAPLGSSRGRGRSLCRRRVHRRRQADVDTRNTTLIPKDPMRGGPPRSTVALGLCLSVTTVLMLAPRSAAAQCVDEELKEELVGGRHYRGVQDRLFTKAFRHELSAMGRLLRRRPVLLQLGRGRRVHVPLLRGSRARGELPVRTRFHSDATDSLARRFSLVQVQDELEQPRPPLLRAPRLLVRLRQAAVGRRRDEPLRLQPRPRCGGDGRHHRARDHRERGPRSEAVLRQVVRAPLGRPRSHPAGGARGGRTHRERHHRHAGRQRVHSVRQVALYTRRTSSRRRASWASAGLPPATPPGWGRGSA